MGVVFIKGSLLLPRVTWEQHGYTHRYNNGNPEWEGRTRVCSRLPTASARPGAVKAAWKNVATPSGIQVPDEPLELSVVDHSTQVSSMLLKSPMPGRQALKRWLAWLRNDTVNHLKRGTALRGKRSPGLTLS